MKFLLNLALKTFNFGLVTVGVPVIITNEKKEILLGKRSMNVAAFPNTWGLPGGVMDFGETLEGTAKREVKEELGANIKIIRRSKEVYNVLPSKGNKIHSINIVFHAKITGKKPKPKDETKEVRWFKPSEIKKMKLAYLHKEILKKEGMLK